MIIPRARAHLLHDFDPWGKIADCITLWLRNNSPGVIAAATIITAAATIVIAWATCVNSKIVGLEKRTERANRMPLLCLIDEPTGDHRSIFVKNIGYGPALNIVRKIIKPGKLPAAGLSDPLPIGALGPGDRAYAFAASLPPFSSTPIIDDPDFHAVIECDDVLGNSYSITYSDRKLSSPIQISIRTMPPSRSERI